MLELSICLRRAVCLFISVCVLAGQSSPRGEVLQAGQGVVDITPPNGLELAGFHRAPGKERRISGVRQRSQVRALHLRMGATDVSILSLDICGFDAPFAERVQKRIGQATGIPAENVRVCATHTHAMPTLRFFRQWGAVSPDYSRAVEDQCVEAAQKAKDDLARADLYYGEHHVTEGNHNRTSKTWKTNENFGEDAAENERWLDTKLRVLYLLRDKPHENLAWYQFSAHPVCYTDELSGPDWPGLVSEKLRARDNLLPSFLQGHCGDVNPGPGTPSLGDPEKVSEAVYAALHHAINHSEHVEMDRIISRRARVEMPLNIALLKEQLQQYRSRPEDCTRGEWVDAPFAKDWFESASRYDLNKTSYAAPISALNLGQVAVLFHPAELYSFYGLAIERGSPFGKTIVVGYADDFIGYVPDPLAHQNKEYAAVVVPKILDLPPYDPKAGRKLLGEAIRLLQEVRNAGSLLKQ